MTCQGGVVTLSRQTCRWNWPADGRQTASSGSEPTSSSQDGTCHHLLPPRTGECCPRCKTCKWNGGGGGRNVTADHQGGPVSPDPQKEPCTQCQCLPNGQGMTCTRQTCPVLPCPANKALLQPGACCPVCQGVRKEIVPSPPSAISSSNCHIGKKTFELGAKFRPDPCTNCTCQANSTTVCRQQEASSSSIPAGGAGAGKSIGAAALAAAMAPTALPASRPLTCAYRGVTYQDGAGWSLDPCTQCSCAQGEVRCAVQQCPPTLPTLQGGGSSQPCPPGRHPVKEPGQCCPKCVEDDAVCTVFGDPHYRTFDGRVFNFQGACKYLLTSDCRNDTFSVRVTNDARSSRSFSWTKTVTLTIEDLKVTLGQNMKVKVNHKRVSLPFVSLGVLSVVQEGYSVVVRTNLGVKLLWDGESFLEVTVPPAFKRRLCGLCGNFNGRRRDDLRMRSGQLAQTVEQFGASWKVGGPKSCSSATSISTPAEEPLCQRQWHIRIRAVRECSVLKAATFAQCHPQVSPVRFFKSCLLDMCECPSGKQCYCEALTAYAHECARHGVTQIDPKWREVTACTGHHHHSSSPSSSTTSAVTQL
ncbi:hypothetical protein DAPPUDRAFT_64092 [Daphnia pulex]|uniref:VWFD domain-containing protein n=1 Tax=Daphnia pulex TaxID=6669 RepID=E9HMB1_DAPPU|nr:hypothetical protein DAPPUDRAFT_64092 [Daphnia pulex]|eukprot:EFX67110.1 hypothetical protein DAPPUDRAFT_64092 [Daphnia pulex]